MLRNIERGGGDQDVHLARHTFLWLVGAKRPLQLSEIAEALFLNPKDGSRNATRLPEGSGSELLDNRLLVEICRNFVNHNEKTDILELSHFSIKVYILRNRRAFKILSNQSTRSFLFRSGY